jgi:chloramphenicol O-acetyltransferase type B
MKIDYFNMAKGQSKFEFALRYIFNQIRTWYYFHIKYPWVSYSGFVRVMAHTSFAKRVITIGNKVQFGRYCSISSDVRFGNNILIAGSVYFAGKHDHLTNLPGTTIWDSPRGKDETTIIEDDVWIGANSTIIAGITIGKGSVVAASSLVNKDIPPCEIWGGVPARKIKDRFIDDFDKNKHLLYLSSLNN